MGTFLFLVCFLISVLIRTFAYEKERMKEYDYATNKEA
ncbi:hypothetical protein M124_0945 [Bacteroides fragilis str. 3988T(B)14]|uniref:Uncharacterized protein n=2 Tax=Bacteroides fragilis TaxID=817 RepID=A0A015SSS5_BACFG|nr:hypothetical protein M077_2902 [Bacteroides fragilis str. 2-F-2 \